MLTIDPTAPPQAIAATLSQLPPQRLDDVLNLCRQQRLRERLKGMALQVPSAQSPDV